MTRKLYDQNAYLAEFSAKVEEIRQEKDGYAVLLDQTAFSPKVAAKVPTRGRSTASKCSTSKKKVT